jgi:hypothetical protein
MSSSTLFLVAAFENADSLYCFRARSSCPRWLAIPSQPKSKSKSNMLRLTFSRQVHLGVKHQSGAQDQIYITVSCEFVEMWRSLWREDGSVVCNCCWPSPTHSRVRVPRDSWPYFIVSDSRLPQPGGPGPHIYIPQEQGGAVIFRGTGFPSHLLLRLAGLRWRYWPRLHTGRPHNHSKVLGI